MPGRFDLSLEDLSGILSDQPAYRTRQVWRSLYLGREPEEMTDLPQALRARLAEELVPGLQPVTTSVDPDGETTKWLWSLADGARVETVLMAYPSGRVTVCVSSQAGCAMACTFCATGQAGFQRQLTPGEIVEQVIRAGRASAPGRVSNVVFMGMGEPLANYGATWAAVERLHGDVGLSARHLTVSTVGIVPGILRLAEERLPVNLAVSLHAANDELRDSLVPINRRYPLAAVVEACQAWIAAKNRRLSFEWALIDGVNDRPSDAAELAALARPLSAHVNLIPLNPTPGYLTQGTPPIGVRAFRDRLLAAGVNATVRRNRGTDIAAACGQLAAAGQPPSAGAALTE
ncbi:MAG: 23S rRNA (adenine(2503)-C(2))-methyltransferase RlmN [Actinomycetota bacterium]|nr:23S rRNA (adenine(2503)-C(2))-methyltransferase RlmN [Actinomycetota bacterium]